MGQKWHITFSDSEWMRYFILALTTIELKKNDFHDFYIIHLNLVCYFALFLHRILVERMRSPRTYMARMSENNEWANAKVNADHTHTRTHMLELPARVPTRPLSLARYSCIRRHVVFIHLNCSFLPSRYIKTFNYIHHFLVSFLPFVHSLFSIHFSSSSFWISECMEFTISVL